MRNWNTTLSCDEHENSFITSEPGTKSLISKLQKKSIGDLQDH